MYNSELKKLKFLVENEIPQRDEPVSTTFESTKIADREGTLPVFILETMLFEGFEDREDFVIVIALQPSCKVFSFAVPHNPQNKVCAKILSRDGSLAGSHNRYANLHIYKGLFKGFPRSFVDDIEFFEIEDVMEGGVA